MPINFEVNELTVVAVPYAGITCRVWNGSTVHVDFGNARGMRTAKVKEAIGVKDKTEADIAC
jgi:hypothetical protein